MAVKLTKNELKVQKDRLKQFQRYLPTLQLKWGYTCVPEECLRNLTHSVRAVAEVANVFFRTFASTGFIVCSFQAGVAYFLARPF